MNILVTCMIRVFRNDMWYDMKPLLATEKRAKEIVSRLKRKGKVMFKVWYEM